MKLETRDIAGIIAGIAFCQLVGLVGAYFTMPEISTWYATLNTPSFTPPGWFIGAVWIILYTLMGIALYIIWDCGLERHDVRRALSFFAVQLSLNALWSAAFFGMHSPLFGFSVIILLWLTLLATAILFYRLSKTAGWLLVPYVLWVGFASILNLLVMLLNGFY